MGELSALSLDEAAAIWSAERPETLEAIHTAYDDYKQIARLRLDLSGDRHISAGFEGAPWNTMDRDEKRAAVRAAATGKDNKWWRAVAVEGFATIYGRAR